MITKLEQQAIKSLMQDQRFDVITKLYEEFLAKWKDEPGVGFDEFNTLKLVFTREGKIEGLTSFFKFLDDQSFEGNV